MGTPDFAVPCLRMLIREGYQIEAVVTQPDKPKGRGKKLASPPVKLCAQEFGIKVLQPEKVKTEDFINQLRSMEPDMLVTVAYGKILPKEILDIPKLGCVNVHASLLPKYRGAAPIQWAIINGEKVTGITTMLTNIGMDTGDILLKSPVEITDDMTAGELHDKLALLGADVLRETIEMLRAGILKPTPQNHDEATYAPMIKKEIGQINWNLSSGEIHNLVRGLNPWPGAYTFYNGERMRIWKTTLIDGEPEMKEKPGTICRVNREGLIISTGSGVIRVDEVQFDSCRTMSIGEYICGNRIVEGEILGQQM
ncbi:MAG TPA: methionyl-tRNA formyltransferase [Clostridiaceae bacterium]|nr:methionyl-tRNA formyltransferase [Clostridiaceae bacterium]